MWGQNRLEHVRDGIRQRESTVADFLTTFEDWLPLHTCDTAEWICSWWFGMWLKKWAIEIREERNNESRENKWLGMDLGVGKGKLARSNHSELPNTMCTVKLCRVSNGKDTVLTQEPLYAWYTYVRQWEELVDFINKNRAPKEAFNLRWLFKCTVEQDELEAEYIELFIQDQMINDPIYGQILYHWCHSNAIKLKLGYNVTIFLI